MAGHGRVNGDLVGGKITIEEGSFYHGRVKVEGGEEAAEEMEVVTEIIAEQPKKDQDPAQPQMF